MHQILAFLLVFAAGSALGQSVTEEVWGKTEDGKPIALFTLTNKNGLTARVTSWGAMLIGMDVPDRAGSFANVTLYLDDCDSYLAGHPVLGSTIGRYANRIDTGGFEIDGQRFDLETFNPKTKVHIHGGKTGFAKQNWASEPVWGEGFVGARFSLTSPDGHEGFPGKLDVSITYKLTAENALRIEYEGRTDKPTHVNLTNHAYWNLAGATSGPVYDHTL